MPVKRADSLRARVGGAQPAAGPLLFGLSVLLGLFGCSAGQPPPLIQLRLTGGQIPTELVESWLRGARSYRFQLVRAANPTWSQVGFEALARGECDLACTDRPIEPRELAAFGGRQVRGYRVAWYGYALYVHPDNPLDSIFSKHFSLLLQRKVTDWKELAGHRIPDLAGPINLYGPRKATRGGMILMPQARIWFGDPSWEVLETDEEIVARVCADPQGLGFASIGYDDRARYLGIRMRRTGPPAFPSLEEIQSEQYGLAKVIYVYAVTPAGEAASAAVEYLFSEHGRRAIEATDVWPIEWERAPVAPNP